MTADPEILQFIFRALTWVGIGSVPTLLATYVAWINFPPEIVVDAITDKSKKLSSESKLRLKNLGKLPALHITPVVTNLNVTLGGLKMDNCSILNPPAKVPRLANGETTEVAVAPGIQTSQGAIFERFEYDLEVTYAQQALFLKRTLSRKWRVSLRNAGDEFSWSADIR